MATLKANIPILLANTQYQPGEDLPANDTALVEAWIESGAAEWAEEAGTKVKAKPAAARAGLTGKAVGGESEEEEPLVGKIPKTTKRTKK